MRLFSAALQREIAQVASTHVYTVLFELLIPGAPAPYRIANYDQDIVYFGLNFVAFPVDVDSMEEATSSSLVHINVTVANVTREISSLFENYWTDSPDWRATMWTIDCTQPNETPFGAGQPYGVTGQATDLRTGTFDLLAEGWTLTRTVPGRRFTATSGYPFVPRR